MYRHGFVAVSGFLPRARRKVEAGYWFPTTGGQCSGGVLLAHGLNMNPESWQQMITFLGGLGLSVYRLELKGHRERAFADMMEVSAGGWLAEFNWATEFMLEALPGLPLFLMGYSLGGLLGVVAQLQRNTACFKKQVLLAAALSLKLYTRLALPMTRVMPSLASWSPKEYIANRRGTTGAAYRALFDLERQLRCAANHQLAVVNYPTLVVMRPDGELISYRGMRRFFEK